MVRRKPPAWRYEASSTWDRTGDQWWAGRSHISKNWRWEIRRNEAVTPEFPQQCERSWGSEAGKGLLSLIKGLEIVKPLCASDVSQTRSPLTHQLIESATPDGVGTEGPPVGKIVPVVPKSFCDAVAELPATGNVGSLTSDDIETDTGFFNKSSGNQDSDSAEESSQWSEGWCLTKEAFEEILLKLTLGDETLKGPDGDLYEVFYPSFEAPVEWSMIFSNAFHCGMRSSMSPIGEDCVGMISSSSLGASNALKDVSTLIGGASLLNSPAMKWLDESDASSADERGGIHRESSADDCLQEMLSLLSSVTIEQQPRRAQLIATAEAAAVDALGEHLARFALVGSTACGIHTPDSDVDVVVFTRPVQSRTATRFPAGKPSPVEALRLIAIAIFARDATLRVELIESARVPILVAQTADGELSLDLAIDQPLASSHVKWFQNLPETFAPEFAPVFSAVLEGERHSTQLAFLRCIKWWLKRRHLPRAKEGGYPSLVWMLLAVHAQRCSVYVDQNNNGGHSSAILAALAAFFDRFAERSGLSGTILFSGGTHAEFRPALHGGETALAPWARLSVLDPTSTPTVNPGAAFSAGPVPSDSTTSDQEVGEPMELAPQLSIGSQLLHAYELCRAQRLSAAALGSKDDQRGSRADFLRRMFAEVDETVNTLQVGVPPRQPIGILYLLGSELKLGILRNVQPKEGWYAPFLHRRDKRSKVTMLPCRIDADMGYVTPQHGEVFCRPHEFVCTVALRKLFPPSKAQEANNLLLDSEGRERWSEMKRILDRSSSLNERYTAGAGSSECDGHSLTHQDLVKQGQLYSI